MFIRYLTEYKNYLWAILSARIYALFPLICPDCGGQMMMIADCFSLIFEKSTRSYPEFMIYCLQSSIELPNLCC